MSEIAAQPAAPETAQERVARYLDRLTAVRARLEAQAAAGLPPGLTDPDPGGTERWEAGQVWAHLAEFPSYWLRQVGAILDERAAGEAEPIPFGRTKADPERVAAIERDRRADPAALLRHVTGGIADAEKALRALPADAWRARGLHPTLGPMPLPRIVEEFIVGHLEEHADQLDLLRGR
jgi:hypothetical protein